MKSWDPDTSAIRY